MENARLVEALKELQKAVETLPSEAPRQAFLSAAGELLDWLQTPVVPEAARQVEPGMGSEHPLRILVADDVAVNLRLATLLLSRLGYQADRAKDGVEALRQMEQTDYDLVLMDLNMPEMDGVEATRRIRARPQARQPRVVAMSAHRPENDTWFDEFLAKPIQLHQLKATLRRCPCGSTSQRAKPLAIARDEVLEMDTVHALCQLGSDEFFASLVQDARNEWPQAAAELRHAFETRDLLAVIAQAHQIKGSAATLGARQLAGLASQIEVSARMGQCNFQQEQVSCLHKLLYGTLNELERVSRDLVQR